MHKFIVQLRTEQDQLAQLRDGFRIRLRHVVPDMVLYNLALDVAEQARAVEILVGSEVPRAAMSNARAAFEAALDALYLVADSDQYDERGMYARASELVEQEKLLERMDAADEAIGSPRRREAIAPEDVIATDGDAWEEELPGAKAHLLEVLAEVRADKRWKRHWSGLGSRKQLIEQLEETYGKGKGLKEMADAFYGIQSIHSHPSPRTGMRSVEVLEEGRMAFTSVDEDPGRAAAMSVVACSLASIALQRQPGGGAA